MEEASKERNIEFLKEWRRIREAVCACLTEWHARLLSTWMRLKINWQCQSRIRHINDQFDSVNPPDGHPHTRQFLRCAPQGEPEDAMMLQAFSDRKDAKNFARDVLQVSTMDSVESCTDPTYFPSFGTENTPVPLMQKDCTHQSTWFDTCDQCLGSFRYIRYFWSSECLMVACVCTAPDQPSSSTRTLTKVAGPRPPLGVDWGITKSTTFVGISSPTALRTTWTSSTPSNSTGAA